MNKPTNHQLLCAAILLTDVALVIHVVMSSVL